MIKVNLISKKRRDNSGRNWSKIVTFSLFGLFTTYFIGVTLYVVISLIVYKNKISQVDKESVSISAEMINNSDKLSRFVLTKMILTQIESINKTKFPYLDYLNKISLLLPVNNSLSGIDFKKKGWIYLTVSSADVFSLDSLEKVLLDTNTWNDNEYFSGAYVEVVRKEKDKSYSVSLQIELKNNG